MIVLSCLFQAGAVVLDHSPAQLAPTRIADRDLVERVRATLVAARVLSVDEDEIVVEAEGGAVTLRGCAKSRAAKDEMDLRVRLIPGVLSLENLLRIGCRD